MSSNNFYSLEGIVFRIGDVQEFSNFFRKQEFIVLIRNAYQDKVYEDYIKFECINDKMYELTGIRPGYKVSVSFVIQGKEGKSEELKGKFFNSLRALKIETLEATTTEERAGNVKAASEQGAIAGFVGDDNASKEESLAEQDDDLPF